MKDSWRVFAEAERRIAAPPHLEARVLAAIASAHATPPVRAPRIGYAVALAAAAAIVIAVVLNFRTPGNRDTQPPEPIASRSFAPAALPIPIVARRPDIPPAATPPAPLDADWVARHIELPQLLMLFELSPAALETGPLQLVRLRVRRDVLQELGIALIEPDAAGTVDLAMLVGEDGLPRDIRQIHVRQEEQ